MFPIERRPVVQRRRLQHQLSGGFCRLQPECPGLRDERHERSEPLWQLQSRLSVAPYVYSGSLQLSSDSPWLDSVNDLLDAVPSFATAASKRRPVCESQLSGFPIDTARVPAMIANGEGGAGGVIARVHPEGAPMVRSGSMLHEVATVFGPTRVGAGSARCGGISRARLERSAPRGKQPPPLS